MSRVYELLIHTLTAPYTWFLVLLHSEATRWSYKWLEWVKELDQCSGFLCKPSRNINKCSADISQELTDGQMTQYTCSVFHIALYSPLKRQKRSGLRPRRCHRSTLIAFGLSVRTGRTHLKYTHTETLCTCTYVNEYVYVCVCAPTLQKTQHLVSLGEGITLSDGMGRETGETLRFHMTWRWKQTGKKIHNTVMFSSATPHRDE